MRVKKKNANASKSWLSQGNFLIYNMKHNGFTALGTQCSGAYAPHADNITGM